MPTYDFVCDECDKKFTDLASYDETGAYEGVKCPLCGQSDKKRKVFSVFNFSFSNPVGTDRWNSDGKGHDYRFKYNAPSVKALRENAEAKSHMGGSSEIYGTGQAESDINVDANWGEVK